MMDGGMMTGMWVVWLFWGIFGLLLITLAVLAIIWLARNLSGNSGGGRDDAEQILRREYASGRIDEDEYQRRRAHLGT
ncbi:MAG: SHOCT domain-containing protein [Pseudonocardiaceae bacterium]|nr:SHOCT domain-containing protein [Pseudonocardiaceae bacterium]